MNESANKPFDDQEKVRILLHEYDTLRQEILQRTTHGFQVYGVGALFFVWLMGRPFDQRFWIMLCISVIALLIATRLIFLEIGKAAKRLQKLENTINRLAGEDLLIWENRLGGFATGPKWLWGSLKSKKEAPESNSGTEPNRPNATPIQ
ncbi:MAG: hypothetical protein ABSB84_11580 [Verrucomicrobiota bacterium]|jgi:hypothetical protein